MKQLFLIVLLLFSFSIVYSQCGQPEVLNWQFSSDEEVEIVAEFPEGTTAYVLQFAGLYHNVPSEVSDTLTFFGTAEEGIHVFEINPSALMTSFMDPEDYFYEVLFRTQCESEEWSDTLQFYVSPLSLLNTPGVTCSQPFTIIEHLPDGMPETTSFEIEFGLDEPLLEIEDLSIIVDIGHTYNGDLSLRLISPSGTAVQLLAYPNEFSNTMGMSMLFSDGAPVPGEYAVGIFAPSEPLATFNGEIANGTWILEVTDNLMADYGYIFGGCMNVNTSPCETGFSGKAYFDLNTDNMFGPDEPALAHALIQDESNQTTFFTNSAGDFARCVDEGPVSVSLASTPLYYESIPGSHTISLSAGEVESGLDFALVPLDDLTDLRADIFAAGPDRPGFSNSYYVACSNVAVTCVEDVVLEVELDELLNITSVSGGAGFSLSGNTATVALGTICPMETVIVEVFHALPANVALGTELQSTAILTSLTEDVVPGDNTSVLASVVIGAYDPNDKQVSREEINTAFLETEKYLTYHIRFQNTGTFYAENVIITDTISALLDFNSIELLETSHSIQLFNDGRIIDFTFNNIFLPDSATDLAGSQGYVRYRIKPVADFGLGDTIRNTAYIFFDFNEPIITNTVSTVWISSVGVETYTILPDVYPNPASQVLNIRSPELRSVSTYAVYDLYGKQIKEGAVPGGSDVFTLPVEDLSSGLYLLQLEGEKAFKPVRWMKL